MLNDPTIFPIDPISPPLPKKFPRGAKPTPRHKLAAAKPFIPTATLLAPTQFAVVPKQLSMWCNGPEGNYDVSGDCVSAEEAFAKAAYSVMLGLPEVFIPPLEVERWAKAGGFWDGANLTDVMDVMKVNGFNVGGVNYTDGPGLAVDYSNETVLQAAILQGPVKLGLDANALPGTAGNQQGWYAIGGNPGQFQNEDHCTSLCGYGPAGWLYEQLGVTLPTGLQSTKTGYLFFTWSSIGFVDHAWLMSTVGEAWVRNPTTPGQTPNPTPDPTPNPTPTPVPPVPATLTGTVVIPSQTINVPHFFGTVPVLIPSQSVPVSVSSGFKSTPTKLTTINWSIIIQLLIQYGSIVLPIVISDIRAGKTFSEILADIQAVLLPSA